MFAARLRTGRVPAVMYGRLTSVCWAEDSFNLRFLGGLFRLPVFLGRYFESMPLIFLELINEVVDQAGSIKCSCRRWVSPLVAKNFKVFAINFVDFDNRDIESTTTRS
ncbi:hypothetical protein MJ561_04740 [Klebsiella pneumoniae]|nr:hypothetical protein MJ561_04740 [Klebsiella pneumoniae]